MEQIPNSLTDKSEQELHDILAELQMKRRVIDNMYDYVLAEKRSRFIMAVRGSHQLELPQTD